MERFLKTIKEATPTPISPDHHAVPDVFQDWGYRHMSDKLTDRLKGDNLILAPGTESGLSPGPSLSQCQEGQLNPRQHLLFDLNSRGIQALLQPRILEGNRPNNYLFERPPSRTEIQDGLSQNGHVAYSGPYTGPGPSTRRMVQEAGWDEQLRFRTARRLTLTRKSRVAGPRSSLSISIERVEGQHNKYRLDFNRTPGLPEHVLLYSTTVSG